MALDLNNRQGAVTEAVTVFEALVAGFGAQGDLCVKVAQNLEICRTRLASGDGTPEIRRLLRAIDVCLGSPHLIGEIIPNDWTTLVGAAAAAVELHTAFTAAARKALTSLPYALLRSLALRVHNEFGASAASLSMIRLIIFESRRNCRAGDLQSALETDQRDLETGIVRTALGAAVAKEQTAEIARLTRDLLEVSDDAAERQHCEAALMRMGSQPEARVVGWVCASVIAACVLWGVLKPSADSDRRRYAPHPTYLPSIQDPDPLTGRAETAARSLQPDDSTDHSEQEPAIGLQTLTLQQLRWCKYTNARVEAARQTLADIRATSGYRQDSYNAATTTFNTYITTLNARCVSYTYHVAELSGVVAEVLERGEQLKREGQQVVMAAYSSIALQSSPSTKPAATPASVQPNVFTARPSPAYQAGQAARQDWEA